MKHKFRRKWVASMTAMGMGAMVVLPGASMSGCGLNAVQSDVLWGVGAIAVALLTNGNGSDVASIPGAQGIPGLNGLNCWDVNGDGQNNADEDVNGDGLFTTADCRGANGANGSDGSDGADGADGSAGSDGSSGASGSAGATGSTGSQGPAGAAGADGTPGAASGPGSFDTFIDDFFTVGAGSYDSLPLSVDELPVVQIEEPALGPADVVAYRTVVPWPYDDSGYDAPELAQNVITMRLFLWRTGPVEQCFVVRLDAFRARHGSGVERYGDERYIRFDDPAEPDPDGTLVVVDLPLNNPGGGPSAGLGWPANLRAGEFLAFELNIVPNSLIDPDVSFTMLGVEFFDSAPYETAVERATVFTDLEAVDCSFFGECREDADCDDGEFCNGPESCNDSGECENGHVSCYAGEMCDEVDDECVECSYDGGEERTVICHVPPGNPDGAHTIVVGDSAVDAHLDHGDYLGPCETDCDISEELCARAAYATTGSGGGHAFWLNGINTNLIFVPDGLFVEHGTEDGAEATLAGTLVDSTNAGRGFYVEVVFGNRVNPPGVPEDSPKLEQGPLDTSEWVYFTELTGTMTGQGEYAGAVIELSRRGAAPQMGVGANGKNLNFGLSTWMTANVAVQPDDEEVEFPPAAKLADINIDIGECEEPLQ